MRNEGLRGGQVVKSVSLFLGGNYAHSGARRTKKENVRSNGVLHRKFNRLLKRETVEQCTKLQFCIIGLFCAYLPHIRARGVSQVLQSV